MYSNYGEIVHIVQLGLEAFKRCELSLMTTFDLLE